MIANKKLLGLFVLAAAAVGTMAASPAEAGSYDRRGRGHVVVYRDACAPRASLSIRVDSGRHHHIKRDRYHGRRDFRRGRC